MSAQTDFLPEVFEQQKPPKKRRSDAGVPRKPKDTPGVLSQDQKRELDVRMESMVRTRDALREAEAEYNKAKKYYEDYLREMTRGA